MAYPTVAEKEAIVKWVSGIVRDVNFDRGWSTAGSRPEFGVRLSHDNAQDADFYGNVSLHGFIAHDEKRHYLAAKGIQKGDYVRVALNPLGILMDVEKVEK